jgi:N-acetylneuraminate lyase
MKTVGLVAAPPTGFREGGETDLDVVAPLAEHLHRQGAVGVFINGTTGEGASLSAAERRRLAQEWRRVLPAGMKLFVHVGGNSLPEAKELARHAGAIGADAISTIAPGFFKPATVDDLVTWCAQVADAAPELPFYFYHMPSINGVSFSMAEFLRRGGSRIPNLAGVKFTHEALGDYLDALSVDAERFEVLWGRDEMLLGALAMGAQGGVGSTYNVAMPLYRRIIEAFASGDLGAAREHQLQAVALINRMAATGHFFGALKVILALQGVPIRCAVRPPLPTPPAEELKQRFLGQGLPK